jgi:hypothetical protein
MQQANRVVAAAVLAFAGQILLGALLASVIDRLAESLAGSPRVAAAVAPLLYDLPKGLCLLLLCYPFGRVTAARPVPTALALFGIVYLFDLGVAYTFDMHRLLYLQWQVVLGRGLLLLVLLALAVWLLGRGRAAALRLDPLPAAPGEVGCKPEAAPTVSAGEHDGPARD